jgi:hypothetical protein
MQMRYYFLDKHEVVINAPFFMKGVWLIDINLSNLGPNLEASIFDTIFAKL